jgi:sec-independent protein translocase protein TatA
MFGLGPWELLIILAIVLLLFGGARLAGLGKSTGRALREFKEETRSIKAEEAEKAAGGDRPDETYRPQTYQPETYRPETVQQQPPAGPAVGPQSSGQPYNPAGEPPINTAWQHPPAGQTPDTSAGEVRRDT